jgi:hypothetical protein
VLGGRGTTFRLDPYGTGMHRVHRLAVAVSRDSPLRPG